MKKLIYVNDKFKEVRIGAMEIQICTKKKILILKLL